MAHHLASLLAHWHLAHVARGAAGVSGAGVLLAALARVLRAVVWVLVAVTVLLTAGAVLATVLGA